jgi:hypothetical protein
MTLMPGMCASVAISGEIHDLVETDADEVDERDLDDRMHAGHRRTGGDADEAGLGNRRVDDALRAELVGHADRGAEHAAELGDVFADDEDVRVLAHRRDDGLAAGSRHRERAALIDYWCCHGMPANEKG